MTEIEQVKELISQTKGAVGIMTKVSLLEYFITTIEFKDQFAIDLCKQILDREVTIKSLQAENQKLNKNMQDEALFSCELTETERKLREKTESQKEEIKRLGKLLYQSKCYLRSIDNLIDFSEEIPNGESIGSFSDASGINAVFKSAHKFLSQEGDK